MAHEEVIQLFDFYWFETQILINKSEPSSLNPVPDEPLPLTKLSQTPSFIVRSFSDQALSSKDIPFLIPSDHSSALPKSVLRLPKLEPILSGKEVREFTSGLAPAAVKGRRRKGRGGNGSRSLSELEFEELKGFRDLGFVFSDEDKDSALASILPGLQRLGKTAGAGAGADGEQNDERENGFVESRFPRPYLSEAWEVPAKPKMINWRISGMEKGEVEIKNQLKSWAHNVASTVR